MSESEVRFEGYIWQDCTRIGLTDMTITMACRGAFSYQGAYLVGSSASERPPTMLTTFFLFSNPP